MTAWRITAKDELLGHVDAPDIEDARRAARLLYGDRLTLHVQSALSAQLADEEASAVKRTRTPATGRATNARPRWRKCPCGASIKIDPDGPNRTQCRWCEQYA